MARQKKGKAAKASRDASSVKKTTNAKGKQKAKKATRRAPAAAAPPPPPPRPVPVWFQFWLYDPYKTIDTPPFSPEQPLEGAFRYRQRLELAFPPNLRERDIGQHRLIDQAIRGIQIFRGLGPPQARALLYKKTGSQGAGWYRFDTASFIAMLREKAEQQQREPGRRLEAIFDLKIFLWREDDAKEAREALKEWVPHMPDVLEGLLPWNPVRSPGTDDW